MLKALVSLQMLLGYSRLFIMKLTTAQQKYFAYWLTRSLPSDSLGKLTASLQDAQVDLTPHQIDAALFAFKSPLSKGVILADEVGNALSKTLKSVAAKNGSICIKPRTTSIQRKKNYYRK